MDDTGFGKLRSFFWPIHRHELKKFVPMLLLFFLVSFNYHLLKIIKDALIITAPESGAEVIPFLKVWAILPSAIGITFLFTVLSNKFNRENIFYVMMSIFIGFFLLFILFFIPYGDSLHLHSFADSLSLKLPVGLKGFIAIIRYWPFALFYVMAEAWSTIMLSLLLWMFIVDVVSVRDAKRYYAFFGTSRNIAGIVSGKLGVFFSLQMTSNQSMSSIAKFLGGSDPWHQVLALFTWAVIICGVIICIIYRYLHKNFYPQRYLIGSTIEKKGKQKISLKESVRILFKSKYLLYITIIVFAYNVVINLTEILWKAQIKELFPSSADYTAYTSKITYFTGIIAALSAFFISGNLIRKMGWKFSALVTPAVLLITGLGFFYFLFLKHHHSQTNIAVAIFGMSPLALAVLFGSLQNCLSRALKYTIFDDTKEMAFIPLNAESKLQGKSVIDGIGSRVGKSGSSSLMTILLMIFSTATACSPYIFFLMILIIPFWVISINRLSKKFEVLSQEEKPAEEKTSQPA